MNRRGFIVGLGAAIAAPAIVSAEILMPVRSIERLVIRTYMTLDDLVPRLWPKPIWRTMYQGTLMWEADSICSPAVRYAELDVHPQQSRDGFRHDLFTRGIPLALPDG